MESPPKWPEGQLLHDHAGHPVATVDWSDYPDWVRERIVEKGIDPGTVISIKLGEGALGEAFIAEVKTGGVYA